MSILCALPLAASLFGACAAPAPLAVGYVEGDFVQVAPIEAAQLRELSVRRGDRVAQGDVLGRLEDTDARNKLAEAEAALAQAQANLADLKIGKRPEEIAVLEATLASARAQKQDADRNLERARDLLSRGTTSQAEFDRAQTNAQIADAALGEAQANLNVARLPARPEAIKAAEKQAEQAQAQLEQAKWLLSQRTLTAPADGRVDDVIRNPGDIAGPSAPVLSMLPDGAVKLRFYVPETEFSSLRLGAELAVSCNGCAQGMIAKVSYISSDPEFTPPVIYSLERRQKLVYLIEARAEGEATRLQPGQIIDARLRTGG
ncbi:HlyD family secretion protein [Limoniibacter endophyticus]|uniref:Hemolysin secretion protein D n=1 Tax=Limoniibacter endophyticus TaxID=1565040 RepID=A0A8J3DI86_9HYPH|nr:HlyD family efflux transporter periplasmic adaptor subunit [Limoniibacter endophyticus]GHC70513.1 hemolysin secretion protein D [Limoniibacter endophyticus]